MSFLAPGAAAFAAVGIAVVAQYFLKLRRPRRTMPSTFLWQRATVDTRANSPWQRLRSEPLMLLQLLAVLVLALALMRPYVLRAGNIGSNVVIVLDASLSTQTVENGRSRFAQEIAKARSIVSDLPPGKSVSLVRLDGRPRVLLAASTDRGAIDSVLDGQHPGYEQPDAPTSMDLALALARQSSQQAAAVIVLRSVATGLPSGSAGVPLQIITYGQAGTPDLGIDSLAASSQSDGAVNVLYRVVNTGSVKLDSDVEIRAGGRLEAVDHVTVPAGGFVLHSTSFLSAPTPSVEAHLTIKDSLSADNTTWAVLNSGTRRKVLVVTPGDVFLTTVLSATTGLAVNVVDRQQYSATTAQGADLVVFDGIVPDQLPPTNLLLIDPPRDVLGVHLGATRTAGQPAVGDDPNGLLRYLTVSDLHIAKVRAASVPDWAHAGMRDKNRPLLLEGIADNGVMGRRAVVLPFDLEQSDLPLSLDFPVLMSNLLAWLAPSGSVDRTSVHPGEFVHVAVPSGSSDASVTSPAGAHDSLLSTVARQQGGQATYGSTDLPGVYTVDIAVGAMRHVSRFVVSPEIAPASASTGVTPASAAHGTGAVQKTGRVPVELTGAIALLVMAILAAEWFVAMRIR